MGPRVATLSIHCMCHFIVVGRWRRSEPAGFHIVTTVAGGRPQLVLRSTKYDERASSGPAGPYIVDTMYVPSYGVPRWSSSGPAGHDIVTTLYGFARPTLSIQCSLPTWSVKF